MKVLVYEKLGITCVISSKRSSFRAVPVRAGRGDARVKDGARGRLFPKLSPKPGPKPNCGRSTLGFFPLSSTRFLALCPTQFTSMRIASRSDTGRACALRRTLVTRTVLGGIFPREGRFGVTNAGRDSVFSTSEGGGKQRPGSWDAGSAGTMRVASSNASLGGPQENPMKDAIDL